MRQCEILNKYHSFRLDVLPTFYVPLLAPKGLIRLLPKWAKHETFLISHFFQQCSVAVLKSRTWVSIPEKINRNQWPERRCSHKPVTSRNAISFFFSSVPVRYLVLLFSLYPRGCVFVDAVNMGLAIEHSVNRHIKIRIWLIN